MKIAVIGSRKITNPTEVMAHLEELPITINTLISGGAKGVDTIAQRWAELAGIKTIIIRPDYQTHGKIAPLIRNKEIVENADMVLAIWDGKSKGTKQAIDHAQKMSKPTRVITTSQKEQISLF